MNRALGSGPFIFTLLYNLALRRVRSPTRTKSCTYKLGSGSTRPGRLEMFKLAHRAHPTVPDAAATGKGLSMSDCGYWWSEQRRVGRTVTFGSDGLGSSCQWVGKDWRLRCAGKAGKVKAGVKLKNRETRKSNNWNPNQLPVSWIACDSKDTPCWSCFLPNARWICSHDWCKIRFCCCCNYCPYTLHCWAQNGILRFGPTTGTT